MEVVRSQIKKVKKYYDYLDENSETVKNVVSNEELWILSKSELMGNSELIEPDYSIVLKDFYKAKSQGSQSYKSYWLRNASLTQQNNWGYIQATSAGVVGETYVNNTAVGVRIGFCL